MAFPTTSVLDSFNRADENPINATNWPATWNGLDTPFLVSSNVASPPGNYICSVHWVTTYGPDAEVYATIAAVGANLGLGVRIAAEGTSGIDAYMINADSNLIGVYRIDDGTFTQLGSDIAQTLAAGDKVGMEIVGSTITVYYKVGAGAWTSIGSRTDSTYTAAGKLGMRSNALATQYDDFGGGTFVPALAAPTMRPLFLGND